MTNKNNIDTMFYSKISDIYYYLKRTGNFNSDENARNVLDSFKSFLYNMAQHPHDHNTTFFCTYPNTPPILYYVYTKMCIFISFNKIAYINPTLPNAAFKRDYINYAFNIPFRFMPVFIAFILSYKDYLTENSSISSFFKQMDYYINEFPIEKIVSYIPTYNEEQKMSDSKEQLRCILGKDYFLQLENIFLTYAETTIEWQILMNATLPLTERFSFRYTLSEKHLSVCENLLKDFNENLANISKEFYEKFNRTDHQYLYKNLIACTPDNEIEIVKETQQFFLNFHKHISDSIIDFLNQNHNENSDYNLAIQNYADFEIFISMQKNILSNMLNDITYKLNAYYTPLCFQLSENTEFDFLFDRTNIYYKLYSSFALFERLTKRSLKKLDELQSKVKKMTSNRVNTYTYEKIQSLDNFDITEEFEIICTELTRANLIAFISQYPSYYEIHHSYIRTIAFEYHKLDEIFESITQ